MAVDKIFRPRRGKQATMESAGTVLKKGEMFFEVPTGGVGTGQCRIKMGDGSTVYSSLPYAINLDNYVASGGISSEKVTFTASTSTTNATLLSNIASGATVATLMGNIKTLLTNLNTSVTELNNDYDSLVDSVNEASNVVVGVRNYLSGTEDWSDNIGSNSTILDDTYNGMYVAYNDGTGTTNNKRNLGSWTTDFVIEPSTYYTISFWAKGSGTITTYLASAVESGVNDTGNTTTSSDGAITTTLSENWTRHWVTYKTLDSIDNSETITTATFIPGRCTSGSECYMCGVKLEYGNKSSDWDKRPIDIYNSYNAFFNWTTHKIAPYANTHGVTICGCTITLTIFRILTLVKSEDLTYSDDAAYHFLTLLQFNGTFTSNNTLVANTSNVTDLSGFDDIPAPYSSTQTTTAAISNDKHIGYTTWALGTDKGLKIITTTSSAQEARCSLVYYGTITYGELNGSETTTY